MKDWKSERLIEIEIELDIERDSKKMWEYFKNKLEIIKENKKIWEKLK